MTSKFCNNVPYYLVLLVPALLITGPFLSDLAITILAIIFLINKNNYLYLNNILIKFLLVFWTVCLLSSFTSDYIWHSLRASMPYIRFIFFSIMVAIVAYEKFDFKKKFGNFLLIVMLILILDSYTQLFFGKNIFGFVREDPKRLSSLFGDEYILGSYLLKMSPLLFWSFFDNQKKTNILVFFFFVLVMPIIFFSGQRGPLIMSLFLISGLIIFLKKNLVMYVSMAICILIIGLNLKYNQNYNERIIKDTQTNLKYDNKFILQKNEVKLVPFSILTPTHTALYFTGIEMVKASYFLGQGPKNFRVACQNFKVNELGCSTHPHNFYIQALAEIGFIGFFMLMAGFFYFVHKLYSKFHNLIFKKKNSADAILILGILIILFPLQPNGNLFNNWLSIPTYLTLGLYFYDIKMTQNKFNKK